MANSLQTSKSPKAPQSLTSESAASTTLPAIAESLFTAAGKTNETLGKTDEDKKSVLDWLDRIGKGEFDSDEGKKTLESLLLPKTYLVGQTPTSADLALFASLYPYFHLPSTTHTTQLTHPSITRHFDHIQSLPQFSPILARSETFGKKLVVDVANVPVPVVKIEQKAKKPKEGAAAAEGQAEGGDGKKKEKEKKKEQEGAPAVPAEGEKPAAPKEKKEKKGPAPAVEGAAAPAEGGKKKDKKAAAAAGGEGGGKKAAAAPPVVEAPAPWMIDLRVGKIVDVELHPDADAMYVEKIDVGEAEPRTVVSGLVKYVPIEQMRGKTLIAVCNLKPANLRGIKSHAMVLCATSADGKDGGVEFVDPPAGSLPGERIFFEGFEDKVAIDLLNPKKKIFETVQPGFTTLGSKEAAWVNKEDGKVHKIVSARGVCTAPNFIGASLS
ncbi:nucleic acid-binding protein [Meredithblackwellia eburnea MCA 4105]